MMNTSQFIDFIGDTITVIAKERGYKYPSAIIGQAIIESANGNSLLAREYCNYFGLKCGSSWKGKSVNLQTKEEYQKGTLTTIRDNFRVYDSVVKGVQGYFDFIQYDRYKNLKTATSSKHYLELLKQDGYCTSSTYVNNVYKIVVDYNLEKRFDNMTKKQIKNKHLTGDEIIAILVDEVIAGEYGNARERRNKLGELYGIVQENVNRKLKNK